MRDPTSAGFVPPPYPFALLGELQGRAELHEGGMVDLSIGTPCDPPPPQVVAMLSGSGSERGYPPASGSLALREAAAGWMGRRFGVHVEPAAVAACVGTKEFVSSAPQWLRLRRPERDTVLYPAISYPTYEMGAILSGCRAVRIPVSSSGTLDLAAISVDDAERALCLWVNSPGNPTGVLDSMDTAAEWGRRRGVPVLSDECYAEFTWAEPARTILQSGLDGVLAVHSLSKRSNLAGVRVGFVAGDGDLVGYLADIRRHAGLMVPGPAQAAAAVALSDDEHVAVQRDRYIERLRLLVEILDGAGIAADLPAGAFYLWVRVPEGMRARAAESRGWELARWLASEGGILASPGEFYGPAGDDFVRLAAVQPIERIEIVAKRLAGKRVS